MLAVKIVFLIVDAMILGIAVEAYWIFREIRHSIRRVILFLWILILLAILFAISASVTYRLFN
jgi:hypothetical protein